jgi:quinolinate synthase
MYRIDLPHLCWALENLVEGNVVNEVKVDPHTRKWAMVALERMLDIKGSGNSIGKQQPVSTTLD